MLYDHMCTDICSGEIFLEIVLAIRLLDFSRFVSPTLSTK